MAKKKEAVQQRVPRRERELQLALSAERALMELRRSYGGSTNRYAFLEGAIAQLMQERLILQAAIQGDPMAIRSRKQGNNRATHPLGV